MNQLTGWIQHQPRPIRFFLAGGLGTAVNLVAVVFFVEMVQMKSFEMKNLANGLGMVVGAVSVFFLHRAWTWRDVQKQSGWELWRQFYKFAGSLSVGVICRLLLFAVVERIELTPYLINVAAGIAFAAVIDYFLFGKLVFVKKPSCTNAAIRAK